MKARPSVLLATILGSSLALGLIPGCTVPDAPGSGTAEAAGASVAVPLAITETAYEHAGEVSLDEMRPENHIDLHNIYHLSDNIISGSEPGGVRALKTIADMGVKTILSVDGKVPDSETAARYGMRYVHIPIRYRGITSEELLQIAKTFRELEGPFYVHCFHGKHRGPAAAAVGRLVLDGASRGQAIAEMRQWCGTSGAYEGLYRVIAAGDIPTQEKTKTYSFDFPNAFGFQGFRHSMVEICRTFDNLKALHKNSWATDPRHPDLNPAHEARQLAQSFRQAFELEGMSSEPEDFQGWMASSVETSQRLHELLDAWRKDQGPNPAVDLSQGTADGSAQSRGEDDPRIAAIDRAYDLVQANCQSCHAAYRNEE